MAVMKPFLSQDVAHGGLPTLFAAVADEAVPGGYYGPDGVGELKGHPTAVRLAIGAMDPAAPSGHGANPNAGPGLSPTHFPMLPEYLAGEMPLLCVASPDSSGNVPKRSSPTVVVFVA